MEVVEALLRAGARMDVVDSRGRTPLAAAAASGHTDMVRLLVARGADVLAPDIQGRVPGRLAYEANQRETALVLADLARRRYLVPHDQLSDFYSPDAAAEANGL